MYTNYNCQPTINTTCVNPNTSLGYGDPTQLNPVASPSFGRITSTVTAPRIVQFADPMPHINATSNAQIDFIVFLNRREPGFADLYPYRKDVARCYMRQVLFGTTESKAKQYAEIERLLTAEVLELRYESLDWAVERLERLIREGR